MDLEANFTASVTGSVSDVLLGVGTPEGTHLHTPSRDRRRSHGKTSDSLTKVYDRTSRYARANAVRCTTL